MVKAKIRNVMIVFVLTICMSISPTVASIPGIETTITAEAASKAVALSKKTVSVAVAGKTTVQLKNVSKKKKVTWSSSNKKIATVKAGKSGKVTITGKKAGKATITGKYNGKKFTVKVTVKAPALSKKSLSLTVGKKSTITLNNIVSTKKITWKSSKTSVATVKAGKNGKVTITGKKAGTANITASYNGKKYTCKVTVKGKVAAPKLSKTSLSLTAGKSGSITLENPVKGKGVTAKSSNTKVATAKVSSNKITISAKSKGTVTVTVSHNGKSYKCTVKVAAKAATEPSKEPETSVPTKPSTPVTPTQPETNPSKPTQPSTESQQPTQPSTDAPKETESGVVIGGDKEGTEDVGDKTTKPDEGNNGNDDNGDNNGNGVSTLQDWWKAPVYSCVAVDKNTIRMVVTSTGSGNTIGLNTVNKNGNHTNVFVDCLAVGEGSLVISYDAVMGTGDPDGSTANYRVQYFKGNSVGRYNYEGREVMMFRLIEKVICLDTNQVVSTRIEYPLVECRIQKCACGAEFHLCNYGTGEATANAVIAHQRKWMSENLEDLVAGAENPHKNWEGVVCSLH